jgi:hypothetical protein
MARSDCLTYALSMGYPIHSILRDMRLILREEGVSLLPVRRSTATRLHLETVGILFAVLLGKFVRKGSQDAKALLPLGLVTCCH